jgi:EmrB/QacA subfamily drug resistance transporter
MLSMSLVAIDSTIIATAVPSVVADLGGFGQFPWLFSVYLLAQAVTVPVYGKLADLFGRKPVMLFGIGLFLTGSILCSAAWSMLALIIFRALQGLGAGAIQPMSMTIAGDIYTLEERGRVQGYLASVWGVSAVVGPTLGGVFSEYLTWRWIFFVNIPLCVIAASALIRNFREQVSRKPHRIDYAGSALLALGCSMLILGLLEDGQAWPWISVPGIGVLAVGLALMALFIVVQRRAAEPVLPSWLLRRRVLIAANLTAVGVGAVLIGLTSYVPTYAQRVLGTTPLVAGFALAALTVGWPITSSQSSKVYLRAGFRATALIGSAVAILGTALTILLGPRSSVLLVGVCCFVVGAGLGFVAAPVLIAAQNAVGWDERGVVTAANMFSRSIGSALGVAFFGAIANASFTSSSPSVPALAQAAHHVFIGATIVAVLMGLATALMPRPPYQPDPVTGITPDAAEA